MAEQIWRRTKAFLVVLIGFLLAACGSDSGGSGTLQVGLTDLPSAAYNSVVITVKEVRVVSVAEENGNGITVFTLGTPAEVDVLDYKDLSLRIGEGIIPAVTYSQIRLVLEENPEGGDPVNYVTLNSDPEKKWPLKTPSGHTSGLKILLPENLVMEDDAVVLLTIDFAPETAIVERGDWDPAIHEDKERFLIKPTGIRVIQEGTEGTYGILSGTVEYFGDPGTGPLAVVTAYNATTLDPVAVTLVDPLDEDSDDFRFFLDAGLNKYHLMVTADGYVGYNSGPPAFDPPVGPFTVDTVTPNNVGTITLSP